MVRIFKKSWTQNGLINNYPFDQVNERLHNTDPYSAKDGLLPKKTIIGPTGFGSRWRQTNPGAGIGTGFEGEEEKSPFGSGYNDGGRADDETGIGNTPRLPDPYYAVNTNEVFLDITMKDQQDVNANNKAVLDNLKKVFKSKTLKPVT